MPHSIVTHAPDFKDYGIWWDGSEQLWFDGDTGGLVSIRTTPDPVSTVPLNGRFVLPTYYYAHYVNVNGRPFDYKETVVVPYHPYPAHHLRGVAVTGHLAYNPYEGCSGTGIRSVAVPNWVVSAAIDQATNEMRDSALNLAVSVLETVKDAPSMVKSMLKAARLIQKLRHGHHGHFFAGLGQSIGSPKGAASAWLQFKFGIMPLLTDIDAGVKRIQQGLAEPFDTVDSTKLDPTFYPESFTRPPWFQPSQMFDARASWKRGCKIGLTFSVPNPYIAMADSLGLTNPLSIAWETMRLSFVIDWLLPIGPFLSWLTTPLVYNFHHGYRTDFCHTDVTFRYTAVPYGPVIGDPETRILVLDAKAKHMDRIVLSEFPIPWPYPKLYINTGQLATAIAMLVSSK